MPTYSYRCTACENAFDIQQSFTDDSLTECPSCGGRVRKVFGAVGVTFNGSGFYRTDSRAAGKSSGGSGDTAKKKPATSGDSSKKESSSSASVSAT